ncbi:MAG: hypothetical protein Q8N26_35620 [Myxococcales bacterium]|nr:hypothetical protein [Myxococcales bacterium]
MRSSLTLVVLIATLFTTDAEACSCQAPGAPCASMFWSVLPK